MKTIILKRKINIHLQIGIWFVIILACFIVGGVIRDIGILGYTGDYIHALTYSLTDLNIITSDNFYIVGKIFRAINLFGFSTIRQWSYFLSVIFFPMMLIRCRKIKCVNLVQLFFICSFVVYFSACVCNISKEAIQVLFFYLCELIIFTSYIKSLLTKCLIVTGLLIGYGVSFRKYFLLSSILFFGLCYLYIIRKDSVHSSLVKDIPRFLLIVLVGMLISKIIIPNAYYQIINVRTTLESFYRNANTLIGNTKMVNIGNQNIQWITNYLLSSIRIMFPIEFILKGIKYALFAVVQIIFSLYLFGSYDKSVFWDKEYRMAYFLILSFIIVELVWQIDLGTMFRHETTIFPLMITVFFLREPRTFNQA